ncbi:lysophospholipid acyltransferase family protein [Shimia aestuarii]|uniref:KDO2-lipid IV(A) lauroyltransferase n=1 Tax=Shimia aestuarii TaxID=254406 RepID=A0A1I4T260_9RHOB|nr:lysophospholipid acyltransferase family protein [Shimia aestuarii]SFM70725.1 KDO2-lipid IV(A) lauroyltransferase [Shimia aestuarii]
MAKRSQNFGHWVSNLAIRGFLGFMNLLPYELRLHVTGLAMSRVVAPLSGARRRIRANLALIMPDLSPDEVHRIVLDVPYHMGRSVMELYAERAFADRIRARALEDSPGLAALEQARAEGRGIILISGHIGNYDAVRAALEGRGFSVGGLYKPMKNPYFNAHYVKALSRFGAPVFERSRRGMAAMVKFLRGGGTVGIIFDQRINKAPLLNFMGKPARTALSAAELALKYDALLVPCYGVRKPDGSFDLIIEPPVPHSTPEAMTQALNDSLERQVYTHPEQWMWTHNRWKKAGNDTPDDR